jgi:hypothetical protein
VIRVYSIDLAAIAVIEHVNIKCVGSEVALQFFYVAVYCD